MGALDAYKIDLKGMMENTSSFEFVLDDHFFASIDAPGVQKGHVTVSLEVKKTAGVYDLYFHTEGVVQITCDRCLDEMDQEVVSDDTLRVKLGEEYSEDDEMVIIPENEGVIDVAWFMYEFISLSIPMKHVHAPGLCNQAMMGKLTQYMRVEADAGTATEADIDETPREVDPRWNELKKIIDNN